MKAAFKSIALRDCHEVYETIDHYRMIARWGLDMKPLDSRVEITDPDGDLIHISEFIAPYDEKSGEIDWELFDNIVSGIAEEYGFIIE